MAVTTTPQSILTSAYGKSKENIPSTIVTESAELLQVVIRSLRGIFAVAARINPLFFSTKASVAFVTDSWPRPVTAESILRIENPSNVEVHLVPYNQRKAEQGKPALYRIGQKYYPAGNTNDPVSGNLTFFYSKRPADPPTITDLLDPLWEGAEQFNELLILEVAIYLAIKDDRQTELGALMKARDSWANLFVAFLEHEDPREVRSYGHVGRFNTATRLPITSLLAGGAPSSV